MYEGTWSASCCAAEKLGSFAAHGRAPSTSTGALSKLLGRRYVRTDSAGWARSRLPFWAATSSKMATLVLRAGAGVDWARGREGSRRGGGEVSREELTASTALTLRAGEAAPLAAYIACKGVKSVKTTQGAQLKSKLQVRSAERMAMDVKQYAYEFALLGPKPRS